MTQQTHLYNPSLSANFINLALAAHAQCIWEGNDPDNEQLENPFRVPLTCYEKVFAPSKVSGEAVKIAVEGPIREQYDFVGSIRFGHQPVADYEERNREISLSDIQNWDTAFKLMVRYSQRWSEGITNTIRYNRSHMLMGFALRSKTDGHGVIVLRGTLTPEEWLNNLNYRLTSFRPPTDKYGRVHLGFRNIYKGLRGRYRELADEFGPEKNLYLVGHSLGAALSTLGAMDLCIRTPERASNLHAYLFASPRVGDGDFALRYNEHVGTSYRIVNVCDIVPYIPFEEMNAVADILSYPYADTKGEMAYVHQTGNPLANHVASYHLATCTQAPGVMDTNQPRRLPELLSYSN